MELSPIIGIRMVPAVKAPPTEAVVSAEFDIQPTAWLGDDSYTGSGKKAAGGDESEEELNNEEIVEPADQRAHGSSGISYFA